MDGLRALGRDVWFNLGDRDLAIVPRARRRLLGQGLRLTEAHARIVRALGVARRACCPMSRRSRCEPA